MITSTISNFKYYVNTNKSIVFAHNTEANKIERIYKDQWASTYLEVLKTNEKTGETWQGEMDCANILDEKQDVFKTVNPIASTTKQAGFFEEYSEKTGGTHHYLNEYLNSEIFIKAKQAIDNTIPVNPIGLLENNCPNITLLLRNLFYEESDAVLQNFLNWLAVIAYKNTHQDIFWLFKGTDEENQGQGAGKGVFRDLMSTLLSGLVVSVNNNSYKNNFNSQLMNMKLIIFDEVDFKALNYEAVKDMTGSSLLYIEFKGKEPIRAANVASWLFFTNMSNTFNKIQARDRRCFLIHPNPINDSLRIAVGDMGQFIEGLRDELPAFINVIAHCDTKVLKPNELRTKAHIEYFSNEALCSINDIASIAKIFTNDESRRSYFDFLEILSESASQRRDYSAQKYFIEKGFIYFQLFEEIYEVFLTHNIAGITKKTTAYKAWKELVEELKRLNYGIYQLDSKRKILDKKVRIKHTCWRSPSITDGDQKKIIKEIVQMVKSKIEAERLLQANTNQQTVSDNKRVS